MTTNTQLTTRQHNTPSADEFGIILQQSQMLVKTGFLPNSIKTPEQALAIILTGRELGIPAMAALNTINVIQGKPTVSPQLMLALIERSQQLDDIVYQIKTDSVSVTMKRKGRTPHTETFGWDEAKAMGLSTKDNYRKQAVVMFKWRAVAACARMVFPDVILGLYTPDEMGATVNEDGQIIAAPETVQDAPVVAEAQPVAENATEATETPRRAILLREIADKMHQLNAAGDSIKWDKTVIAAFIAELYGETATVKDLTDDDLNHLFEELDLRLDLLNDEGGERNFIPAEEKPVKKGKAKGKAASTETEVF